MDAEALAGWIAGRRWFAAKTRRIARISVEDELPLGPGALVLARVTLDDGSAELYGLALGDGVGVPAETDALDHPAFGRALLELIARCGHVEGRAGALVAERAGTAMPDVPPDAAIRCVGGEQSNTSVAFGDALILKLFRRLAPGINPEQEITRFLTERARFPHAPRLFGHLEYRPRTGAATTVAVLQELVPDARDGWEWMLDALRSGADDETLDGLRRLGDVTGLLHGALASDPEDPAFAPEVIGLADIAAWAGAVRAQLDVARAAAGAAEIGAAAAAIDRGLAGLRGRARIRHHGDLHLGQTLRRSRDGGFVVIDFEGEPLRPLRERRAKHAAARDVAGVLRSIGYAAAVATSRMPADRASWVEAWEVRARETFLQGYRAATSGAPFLPAGDEEFARAVAVFEVEKAAYEIVYEANHRPDWIAIPRRGLARAAARLAG